MDQLSPLQDMFMYLQRPLWFFITRKRKRKRKKDYISIL
jgi:hypothetical protein